MPSILDIGLSGLTTHQRSLSVTGHNIANAATEGYSRQSSVIQARPADFFGGASFGTGVEVTGVRRSVNDFFTTQLRSDISAFHYSDTLRAQLDQLDSLFSGVSTGLSASQERFFSALQAANDDPTSITARQVLLDEAQNLVKKFETLSGQLSEKEKSINQLIANSAGEVTGLADQIAQINVAIIEKSGGGNPEELPNDLLDERDRLLAQLAELVDIRTSPQVDGAINVFIGSGQALVVGGEAMNLVTQPSSYNAQELQLAIQTPTGTVGLNNTVSGGMLGALLTTRDQALGDSINALGRIAVAIADTVNQQHRLGMDLEGNLGGNFFNDINSSSAVALRTQASSNNSLPQDQIVEVSINDVNALKVSDYKLTFTSSTTYVLTRLSDQKTNAAIDASLTGTVGAIPATLQFDGVSLLLDRPSGNFATGDSFLLQPTNNGASDIGLVLDRPQQIALASPIRTSADINNQGTGVIAPGVVTDTSVALFSTTPGQLSPPLLIRFTSATTYDVLDNSGVTPTALVPPQTGLTFPPTPANALIPAGFGIELELKGQPQSGDTFRIDFNANGFQDNRNGLAMNAVQTTRILDNGATTLPGAYGLLIQKVGVQANQARQNTEAGKTLLQQSQARRDEVSAVNLDEEAARLVELEQAYSASAQVINVAITIFEALLGAVRR
ncbi:MAG: flagellar hook-associated protein FlgK [Pseudomonadales bacterium]|nr:flagellar hook-associated protein FlgK [Pseudomonadales bacterium]